MPDQLRGFPQFISFLSSLPFIRTRLSPRAVTRLGWSLRGMMALAGASLWWSLAGPVLAQGTAASAEPKAMEPATATATMESSPAKPLFELPSPWDAPEPWRTDRWYFQFAYYTIHFHYDADHQQSYLFDAEYHFKETWLGGQWIAGMALFQNSFGQFSQYLFGGLVWRPIEDHQPFYVKLTAGPLHGYSGQYKDKIPNNSTGVAPAIIPGVGYCVMKRYCGEFVLLGTNAALLTIGMTVP
jgi:hypothetical protein